MAWQSGDPAHDTTQDLDVTVQAGPGVYGADEAWVRPVDGGPGYLAPVEDLESIEEGRGS